MAETILNDCETCHVIPRCDDRLHVQIAWEEGHHAIWDNLAIFDEDASEVPYHGRIISDFKAGANGDLIAPACNDLCHILILSIQHSDLLIKWI